MHPELISRIKLVSTGLSLALLSSCATLPNPYSADVESRDIVVEEPVTISSDERQQESKPVAIDNSFDDRVLKVEELKTNQAEYYNQQSQTQTNPEVRTNSILSAAEHYIQANNYQSAKNTIDTLNPSLLQPIQADRLAIIKAYIAYSNGQHNQSLAILEPLIRPALGKPNQAQVNNEASRDITANEITGSISDQDQQIDLAQTVSPPPLPELPEKTQLSIQQVDALLLSSFSYQSLGDYSSAIAALIAREGVLVGQARSETTRYIWKIVNSLTTERRQNIYQNTDNSLVRNRVEQSLLRSSIANQQNTQRQTGQENNLSASSSPQQFARWQEAPSTELKQELNNEWSSTSPRSIAILLPTSSRFKVAAKALREGIEYQHNANQSSYRPKLRFYDIGENPAAASQYYAAAIQAGADFIIGPLGKDYANQISRYSSSSYSNNSGSRGTPTTLLLGGDTPLSGNTSRFSLSPEMEGTRIADQAWRDGHLSAGLLMTESNTSKRTVNAFIRKWQSLGGKISKTVSYSPQQFDHTTELKQLFAVNQSEYRHNAISRTLGFKPKFTAYQRADIDFVLMIADNKAGRLIRPQVNFFSGSKVPVYATSNIFDGLQDPIENFDLNDTQFPVMPWVLQSTNIAPYAGRLNMLFALGADAYSVAANYQQLRRNNGFAINGKTGQVSIDRYGETVYQPVWATFKKGQVVASKTFGLDITPLTTPNGQAINHQSVNGTYNDSTYNSQTWNKDNRSQQQSTDQQGSQNDRQDGLRRSR